MNSRTSEELMAECSNLREQVEKYKETIKLYEHHFEKANNEFKQMQEETRYMKQTTEDLRAQMKRIITEYNNIVIKHKEIEEAFISVSYMAKTSPEECIRKLSDYYDQFQTVVEETIKKEKEQQASNARHFTIIRGGK